MKKEVPGISPGYLSLIKGDFFIQLAPWQAYNPIGR